MRLRHLPLLWSLFVVGCGFNPKPVPVPPQPPVVEPSYTFAIIACNDPEPQGPSCADPVEGATVSVAFVGGRDSQLTNKDGYTLWVSHIPNSDVRIEKDGYVPVAQSLVPPDINFRNIVVPFHADHIDPTTYTLEQLAAVRGGMWPLGPVAGLPGGLSAGPRPFAPDNVIATAFMASYTPTEQLAIITELKSRGYTHVVMGPLVDSDGYHGIYTPHDWRGANFSAFLDIAQLFWDHGLIPIVFISPDGWTYEQNLAEFTSLLQQPRAQVLLRIVVPHGWEPERYGSSSCTWALFGQWARLTLPNALVAYHTVSDLDAPVGTDSRCNDDDHTWNPGGNAAGWARSIPFFHLWLTQSSAFENPTATGGDHEHPELTNFQNWQRQFDVNVRGSYRDRFEHGYAGWPMSSAWGPGKPLRVVCGEYKAYWTFWQHRTEAEGVTWGDACIAAGGYGYLDSGSVPVPQVPR